MKLNVPEIFSWDPIFDYLNRNSLEPIYQLTSDGHVRRAFPVDEKVYLCDISFDEKEHCLQIDCLNEPNVTSEVQTTIEAFVADWFDLSQDLEDFYQFASGEELLKDLPDQFNGLRLVGVPDFYEAVIWGILGQQINLAFAYELKRRFVEKYGTKIEYDQDTYWLHPNPEVVGSSSIEELLTLRLTQRKAEYILDISKRIARGEMTKEYYQQCENLEQAEKELVKIRGIGPWTANYVLMRCLRYGEAFPMKDIGLLNGIKEIKGSTEKPQKKEMLVLKKRWGKWCSYAVFYIWRVLY